MSKVYKTNKLYIKAIENLEEIKGDPCSYQALGVLYSNVNKTNEAIKFLKKTAEMDDQRSEIQLVVGYKCFEFGNFLCSLDYVQKAININNNISSQK